MKQPVISVIVPVYNAENYLNRCVDSLLSQTFADYELILVNDGSKDSSGVICDSYAAKDNRVRVFHKANGGVSSARNIGLDNARGEWIVFCDSDDYVSERYLENLISGADDENIDLVFNYAVVHNIGEIEKENYPEKLINLAEISDLFLNNDLAWHTSTWSKLFKRDLIERLKLRYITDIHIGEDAIFLFTYMLACRKIRVICTCDYHYLIVGDNTLTQRINNFKSEERGMQLICEVMERIKQITGITPKLKGKFDWITGSYKRRALIALFHDNISHSERMKFLKTTDFSDYITSCGENSKQGKVYLWLLSHGYYWPYDLIRSTIQKIRK